MGSKIGHNFHSPILKRFCISAKYCHILLNVPSYRLQNLFIIFKIILHLSHSMANTVEIVGIMILTVVTNWVNEVKY